MSEVQASASKTPEEQVEWWMEKYFALQDEHAACLNQLMAIRRVLDEGQ